MKCFKFLSFQFRFSCTRVLRKFPDAESVLSEARHIVVLHYGNGLACQLINMFHNYLASVSFLEPSSLPEQIRYHETIVVFDS